MKTIRVSAAVIHKDGKIYATRRGYGEFKGLWEFPGGKREEGETGEDTIIREIKEELDVDIKVEKFLTTVEYQYPEFYLIMDNYLCSIENGKLELTVHDDAKWLSLNELDSVQWLKADVLVVESIKKHFRIDI